MINEIYDNYFENITTDVSLPSEYFEKICDLENSLIIEKDIIKVENLARLYKIGVEYYSSYNSFKSENFLHKLHNLLVTHNDLFFTDDQEPHMNDIDFNKRYKQAIKNENRNKITHINKDNIKSLISEFELKFNDALKLINKDLATQEDHFIKRRNKKKRDTYLLMEVVSTINNYYLIEINTKIKKIDSIPSQ